MIKELLSKERLLLLMTARLTFTEVDKNCIRKIISEEVN